MTIATTTATRIAEAPTDWLTERPIAEIPPIANWSENYCWDAYDPETRIGFWMHTGRWYRDTTMWREMVIMCIDGKEVYSRRNIGRLPDNQLVGASCLRLECLSPFERWSWKYHGPALKGTPEHMLIAPPPDTTAILLEFNLDWEAACPVIDFGHGTEPGETASHYEQGGLLKGKIKVDGKHYNFDGRSFRDHSRGPRVLQDHFRRHSWIHATFPSGRSLSTLIVEQPDGSFLLSDLFTVEPGESPKSAAFKAPVLWDDWNAPTRAYDIAGIYPDGREILIHAEPQFFFPVTLGKPIDLYVGHSNNYPGWRVFQMPTRFVWDGEETFGHTEFSLTQEKSSKYPMG
jgi:hypothetical protein